MATTHPPTSRAPNRPPDLTAFTVAHRALRTDGARLAAAAAGLGAGNTARAQALRRWYGGFEADLTGHHRMEDHLWFPVLAERVPTFAQHADRIDREHHMLDDAIAGARAALAHLVDGEASEPARRAAQDATCELSSLLDAHLGFEDADVLPLFLRHFTEDEYAEVERRAGRFLELRNLPFTVPQLLRAATPGERERILGRAPLAMKLVWFASRRRHARLSARALGSATRGVA
jgi:Hemerythrin HHE cation binding domain